MKVLGLQGGQTESRPWPWRESALGGAVHPSHILPARREAGEVFPHFTSTPPQPKAVRNLALPSRLAPVRHVTIGQKPVGAAKFVQPASPAHSRLTPGSRREYWRAPVATDMDVVPVLRILMIGSDCAVTANCDVTFPLFSGIPEIHQNACCQVQGIHQPKGSCDGVALSHCFLRGPSVELGRFRDATAAWLARGKPSPR